MSTYIAVQAEDFDLNQLYTGLRCASGANGAIVTFTGLVRELSNTTQLQALYLEHYPGMTEKALQSIVDQARERWPLGQVTLIHRIGRLALNEQIVFVGASSPHRADAFAAVEFMMDYLKQDAPFWKKEITSSGEHWVEQKTSDLAAAKRWR